MFPYSVPMADIKVGTPGQNLTVLFDSRDNNIILSPTTFNHSASQTYASLNKLGHVQDSNPYFNLDNIDGPLGYDSFNFSGLQLLGQGFIEDVVNTSRIGFSFNQANNTLGFPIFLDSLYQQALIGYRVLAFAYNISLDVYDFNFINIGFINQTIFQGPLHNYSVDLENGQWAFTLTNLQFGNISLGINGYVTIDTNSPFNVVPMPVMNMFITLLGVPPLEVSIVDSLAIAYYDCTNFTNLARFPTVTYYLHNEPLVLTPYQYLMALDEDSCYLAMAGSDIAQPARAAFTLGSMSLNGTYSVFDFEQKTFGIAPLATIF